MNLYRIIGGYTTVEYRSITLGAKNVEDTLELVNEELESEFFSYLTWELDDVKQLDDFEIIEASLITPTSQDSS